jgi:hypothetical protein
LNHVKNYGVDRFLPSLVEDFDVKVIKMTKKDDVEDVDYQSPSHSDSDDNDDDNDDDFDDDIKGIVMMMVNHQMNPLLMIKFSIKKVRLYLYIYMIHCFRSAKIRRRRKEN